MNSGTDARTIEGTVFWTCPKCGCRIYDLLGSCPDCGYSIRRLSENLPGKETVRLWFRCPHCGGDIKLSIEKFNE